MCECVYLMLSTVSSGIGATVCTAGRFLLVAPFTKLDEEEDEEEAESVAPVKVKQPDYILYWIPTYTLFYLDVITTLCLYIHAT